MYAVVCDPNNATPLTPRCEEICAGPVSFDITKLLPFIKDASSCMFNELFWFWIPNHYGLEKNYENMQINKKFRISGI